MEALGTSDSITISEGIRMVARDTSRTAVTESDDDSWSRWAASASNGRVFARTGKGYYVLGPAALEIGDVICCLFGNKVPFCLRPTAAKGVGYHLLVGECYVHGLMRGEAMDMLARIELYEKQFNIV